MCRRDLSGLALTDEQYQAATATLFGSDAMRLAGIAAEQGGEGFEKRRSGFLQLFGVPQLLIFSTQPCVFCSKVLAH